MSGCTKKIYESLIIDMKSEMAKELRVIVNILPEEYDFSLILNSLKKYYVYEWEGFENEYEYRKIKDKHIKKRFGKNRYNMPKPDIILLGVPFLKKILSDEYKLEHKTNYDDNIRNANEEKLFKERNPKILKIRNKIENSKRKTQLVTPDFLEKLIGLYERKTTTMKDRAYILKELKKYYNRKIINFFYKINDTELNMQLRDEAFYHLQSFNFNPRKRRQKFMQVHTKNKKRKQYLKKEYAYETFVIPECPDELDYLLDNSKFQELKEYDYFVSHSSKDSKKVQELIKYLNIAGKYVYCDWINDSDYLKRELICESTINVIQKQLEKSKRLLFVDSCNSRESVWCKYELNYYKDLGKEIYKLDINSINEKLDGIVLDNSDWFYNIDYKKIKLL